MTTSKNIYRDFLIETKEDKQSGQMQCVAYLNGEARFGTFSHNDKVDAKQKMLAKIDLFLSK